METCYPRYNKEGKQLNPLYLKDNQGEPIFGSWEDDDLWNYLIEQMIFS